MGAVALVMTGSTAAYGALAETGVFASGTEEVLVQAATKPVKIVDSPVQKEVVIDGPVKVVIDGPVQAQVLQAQVLQAGPIFSSDAPLVGSIDWMAQEKAEKDQLRRDAAQKQAELEADAAQVKAELEAEISRLEKIASDTQTLNETLVLVKNQIGITPWVFQGSSTRAWDCSGLVRWTYAHLGVDLYHSATSQRLAGEFVEEPKIGDLVSFNHKSYGSAYHIGIYVGPDEMIHAGGKPGDRTEIRSISGWAKGNGGSDFKYTRIIETNNQ